MIFKNDIEALSQDMISSNSRDCVEWNQQKLF